MLVFYKPFRFSDLDFSILNEGVGWRDKTNTAWYSNGWVNISVIKASESPNQHTILFFGEPKSSVIDILYDKTEVEVEDIINIEIKKQKYANLF